MTHTINARQEPEPSSTHRSDDGASTRRALVIAIALSGIFVAALGTALRLIVTFFDPGGPVGAVVNVLRSLTYPNAEGNLWSWLSALMIALLGVAFLGLAGLMRSQNEQWRVYIVLGAVALYLSLDETAQIHENFIRGSRALGLTVDFTYDWLIIGVPLAIVVGAFVLWLSRGIDRTLRRQLIIGGAVYLFGAAVLESVCGAIANAADISTDLAAFTAYQLVMFLEESAEFAGVLIAFAAVLAMVRIERTERGVELIPRVSVTR